jgi:hypothetical protein
VKKTLVVCIFFFAAAAFAQSISVQNLVKFIKSSIELKQNDSEVAKYLRHMKLTDHLDDATVEELQGLGAGPKTIAALREMVDASAKLPEPPPPPQALPPPPPAPPPDSIEQGKIIDAAREYAMNYTKQLPNYLCLEVVRRAYDTNLSDSPGNESWLGSDTVVMRLSYYEQKEDYKVVMVNDRATVGDKSMDKLDGVTSSGEFGSMMKEIFAPESEARFEWDHWGKLRGRKMYVFAYDIDQPHSQYRITWEKTDEIVPAYRGLVYIDVDTKMIMRITQNPYDIPRTFPVRGAEEILDYDFQKIGDSEFLLPLKVKLTSRTIKYLSKNDIEFRLYQKFSADATIKFDETPPPLPDDKVKEK